MGAWGAGNFENDWALDCLGDLRESDDPSQLRSALDRIIKHGGTKYSPPSILERLRGRRHHIDWLKASVASEALAAAEVVAVWLGHPLAKLLEGVTEWVQNNSSSFKQDMASLALQAVSIVKSNSELKVLLEEGDASEWHRIVKDLEQRLQINS